MTSSNDLTTAFQYHQAQKLEQAEKLYQKILRRDPNNAEALHLLGLLTHQRGYSNTAIDYISQAISILPSNAIFFNSRALVYREMGNFTAAADNDRQAAACKPNAEPYIEAGVSLAAQGRLAEAASKYYEALRLQPDHPAVSNNLGVTLLAQKKFQEAEHHFQTALQALPDSAEIHFNLGVTLERQNKIEAARDCYRQAVTQKPNNLLWQLKLDGVCPAIMHNTSAIQQWRYNFKLALNRYSVGEIDLVHWAGEILNCNVEPPFYLHYHGTDDRSIKEQYAGLFSIPAQLTESVPKKPVYVNGQYRVGFLVTQNHENVFLQFMAGVINNLNNSRFKPVIICSPAGVDIMRSAITNPQVDFLPIPADLLLAVQKIKAEQLNIIYFWEVGTDTFNYVLPFFQLAPVQCTSWGSPTTTGISQMDYFISSRLFEADGADAHYSEQVVRLESLGTYYSQPNIPANLKARSYFGLSEDEHIYLCVQNLMKFHPDFDLLLGHILRRDPQGKLLLKLKLPQVNEALLARFQTTLPDVVDRIQFVSHLGYADYLGLLATADVLLDTIYYSGGITTHESLTLGTPVVTLPSQFMRGRMTLGCYSKMGVMDCVAGSPEEYVDIAVKLGTDPSYRARVKAKILAANKTLYKDSAAVQELEQFFEQAIKGFVPKARCSTERDMAVQQRGEHNKMFRQLHIGGQQQNDAWEILDAIPSPDVQHVCDARDLSRFQDNTFTTIYASHVVEHFDYKNELEATLKEWHRVLKPGGKIYISVPDLDVLAQLFVLKEQLTPNERFYVMRMMFGGHVNDYDYHTVGLNQEFLTRFLLNAGYVNIKRVKQFGFFQDTSVKLFKGVPVSLNMSAEKPVLPE